MCLKSNIDERIQFFFFFFFLGEGGGMEIFNLQKRVLNDILIHIMIQYKWNFAFKSLANVALPTL